MAVREDLRELPELDAIVLEPVEPDDIVLEEPLLLGVLEALEPELMVPDEAAVEAEPDEEVEP